MGSDIKKNHVLGEAGQTREGLRVWKTMQELRWIMSHEIRTNTKQERNEDSTKGSGQLFREVWA